MKALFVEPFSGASGDMFLGALCSLLDAYDEIEDLPRRLNLFDAKVEIQKVSKNGIVCGQVVVTDLSEKGSSENAHGAHRHLKEIVEIIEAADIPDGAKRRALDIFQMIGEAESRIHDIPIEKIHFHELSGVDSIVDIVGCSLLIERLEVEAVYCDAVCTGRGFVNTEHGLLPVPAPATAILLGGMPCFKGDEEGERVTPTGAAVLRSMNPIFESPHATKAKTAYGPGSKDFQTPNVLRLSLGEASSGSESLYIVEANLDDCSPEYIGSDFQDRLLELGVLDVSVSSVAMKKGRLGHCLSVLTPRDLLEKVGDFILENSTSIGVRYYPVRRKVLERRIEVVETAYGTIRMKIVFTPEGRERAKPEFEDLRRASAENDIPLLEVEQEARRAWQEGAGRGQS